MYKVCVNLNPLRPEMMQFNSLYPKNNYVTTDMSSKKIFFVFIFKFFLQNIAFPQCLSVPLSRVHIRSSPVGLVHLLFLGILTTNLLDAQWPLKRRISGTAHLQGHPLASECIVVLHLTV